MSKPETTTAPPQLEKCPFCESTNIAPSDHYQKHRFVCLRCGAEGPHRNHEETAAAGWNTRPAEAALREEVEALKAERRWISVTVKQPPENVYVLTWWDGECNVYRFSKADGGKWIDCTESWSPMKHRDQLTVTHWMPLQKGPGEPK